MAVPTITTDLVDVALGEAADAGTWSGGKSSLFWTEGQIEGSGVRAYIANSIVNYDLIFTATVSKNIGTSSVLRIWQNTSDPFRCDTKANIGIALFAGDGTNTGYWNYDGKDTYTGGYKQLVIDTGTTPSSGVNPNWAAVTEFGVTNYKLLAGKNTETAFVDAIRYGNILNAYGGTSGDEINIDGIYLLDAVSAYGIVTKDILTGVYLIRGELNVGDSVGTSSTDFLIEGEVIIGEDLEWVGIDTLQFNFVGNGTGTTTVEINGCFINAAGVRMGFDCSDINITSLSLVGNTLGNLTNLIFQSGQILANNVFDSCFAIDSDGASLSGITIKNTEETATGSFLVNVDTEAEACSNLSFFTYSNNSRYAVYIAASVTEFDMDNWIFDDPDNTTGIAVHWLGTSGTLTINALNGTNLVTAGCSAETGGTVSVVNSKTFSFTLSPSITGYEWRIYDVTATGSLIGAIELDGEEIASADNQTYTYTYTADNVIAVQIISDNYVESTTYYTLGNVNQGVGITLTLDKND